NALFQNRGLKEADIQKLATDFGGIAFLKLMAVGSARLSEQDQADLKNLWEEKKMDEAFKMIREKYSDSEWDALVDQEISPLLDSYLQEVYQEK
ncbi:MAG: hypothetical protein Q8R07_04200, partial [Candidatus Uhrbacteria bacterium]|nr:hypothetical protein [Candidatus Uhrbacteria bacterium]